MSSFEEVSFTMNANEGLSSKTTVDLSCRFARKPTRLIMLVSNILDVVPYMNRSS